MAAASINLIGWADSLVSLLDRHQRQACIKEMPMSPQPKDQISAHEIRVYEAAKASGGWLTARELAVAADVADRTARAHAAAFAEKGVLEVAKVFGGYRYRIVHKTTGTAQQFVAELESAKHIIGL